MGERHGAVADIDASAAMAKWSSALLRQTGPTCSSQNRPYLCCAALAALLCFKHLFVYVVPPVFAYLLVFSLAPLLRPSETRTPWWRRCASTAGRCAAMVLCGGVVAAVAFGPFLAGCGDAAGQLKQVCRCAEVRRSME